MRKVKRNERRERLHAFQLAKLVVAEVQGLYLELIFWVVEDRWYELNALFMFRKKKKIGVTVEHMPHSLSTLPIIDKGVDIKKEHIPPRARHVPAHLQRHVVGPALLSRGSYMIHAFAPFLLVGVWWELKSAVSLPLIRQTIIGDPGLIKSA